MRKGWRKYIGLVLIAVLAIVSDFFFVGKLSADFQPDSIILRGGLTSEKVMISEVDTVEWLDTYQVGKRLSGVDTMQYISGEYQGEAIGETVSLFVDRNYQGEYLELTLNNHSVIVGSKYIDLKLLQNLLTK
jgi:hypothetical protein